ncbi:hypothetical protein MAC_05093 [Metarhizium acridum CQMa 102]|uniref:Tautomerase cis-CaaD-like domain-containing protein n=1 Tax=Metarhizium acridum (strain CQMa 102) TaxID=655827 RepID=E9E5E5_METAQ|nr:uncharacterized protein MAC_05093 [Metarhizium acridum CQMa 102]EFY88828.1 hypothetical protein MAC_05093 [Metarhizium acridum CQMa 102]
MSLYEVHHSHALTESQREELAGAITRLHATTFATPSIFVHVRFIHEDPSDGSYFIAGTRRYTNSNSIIAHVRSSPARTEADSTSSHSASRRRGIMRLKLVRLAAKS